MGSQVKSWGSGTDLTKVGGDVGSRSGESDGREGGGMGRGELDIAESGAEVAAVESEEEGVLDAIPAKANDGPDPKGLPVPLPDPKPALPHSIATLPPI